MATFSVRFLGCKVSHTDAQLVRERLLADGHTEVEDAGAVAVVNTCCVTNEAVRKSRQAAARAATAFARFPVEEQAIVERPNSWAFAHATATTRSLKECVGLAVSSFR